MKLTILCRRDTAGASILLVLLAAGCPAINASRPYVGVTCRKTIPAHSGCPDGLSTLNGYSDSRSWYCLPRARTAIGLTRDSTKLILFTVDKAAGSGGVTPSEVADLLITDYGVYNAINLDGGGSTTLAIQDPATHVSRIVTASADSPAGRAVGSNLAIFARPIPQPTSLGALSVGGCVLLLYCGSRWSHLRPRPHPHGRIQ